MCIKNVLSVDLNIIFWWLLVFLCVGGECIDFVRLGYFGFDGF